MGRCLLRKSSHAKHSTELNFYDGKKIRNLCLGAVTIEFLKREPSCSISNVSGAVYPFRLPLWKKIKTKPYKLSPKLLSKEIPSYQIDSIAKVCKFKCVFTKIARERFILSFRLSSNSVFLKRASLNLTCRTKLGLWLTTANETFYCIQLSQFPSPKAQAKT